MPLSGVLPGREAQLTIEDAICLGRIRVTPASISRRRQIDQHVIGLAGGQKNFALHPGLAGKNVSVFRDQLHIQADR